MPVARIAGTRPKIRQVATASAAVNANTRQSSDSATKIRLFSVVRNSTRKRLSHCARTAPQRRADRGDQQALRQQLTDDAPARRADREANGDLALARGGARQHQVREVGARDQQHQAGRRQQQPERRLVVAAQRRDAGARRERARA